MPIHRHKIPFYYGWIIIFATVIINLTLMGTRFSFGVFFKSLSEEFNLSRAATSSLFSTYMLICAFISVVGGWASDRFGARLVFSLTGLLSCLSLLLTSQTDTLWQLYLSYSLILGIGTGAIFTISQSTISRWFERKRGLAMGISGAGVGMGQMLFAPLAAFLISNFGWRMSYIIMGLLVGFLVVSVSGLMLNAAGDIGALPDGVKEGTGSEAIIGEEKNSQSTGLSIFQALTSREYWIFFPTWVFMGFGNFLVLTHIVPYATDVGIPAMEAATIISMNGILNILSGILIGRISDIKGRRMPGILLALIRAVALICVIWADRLWMFYVFAVVFGITHGGSSPILASLCVDIFGRRNLGVIMGSLYGVLSVSAAIGPFIGGLIYDIYGSYTVAFLITAGVSVLMALSIALVGVENKSLNNGNSPSFS